MPPSPDIELRGAVRLAPGVTVERMGEEFLALVGQRVVRVAGPSAAVLAAVQPQADPAEVGLPTGVAVGPGEVALAVDVLVDLGVLVRTATNDASPHAAADAEPVSVSRRRALRMVGAAATLGVTVLVLPQAAAASSGSGAPEIGGEVENGDDGPGEAFVTAEPIGYVGSDTGAIRVAWSPVAAATGYEVGWATGDAEYTFEAAGDTISYDLTGLVGTDTAHSVVVRATTDATSVDIGPATSSSVIATGGTITLLPAAGTPTHVVHTFTTSGTFTLNRDIDVDYLVVGGGGGGGGCTGRGMAAGGGGGGGVNTDSEPRIAGAYPIVVGAGGRGGADVTLTASPGVDGYAGGGESSSFGGVIALGGGAGGSAPFGSGTAESGDVYALPTPSAVFTAEKETGGGGVGQATRQLGATGRSSSGGNGTLNTTDVTRQLAGGGGGAGGSGTAGSGTTSGSGGVGVASAISGTNVEYGSGGGGGKRKDGASGPGGALAGLSSAGGSGGLGAGGSDGVAGRGGGGGGGARDAAGGTAVGGSGGSGVVIVRFALPS